uniref:ADP-ribosylglycohydrolase n=1 Tax=Hanusia phi TaxID=3032 RepID=A0A7S0HZ39_9CRYP|eukprot:137933-Hanusia_phi.AAC.2
MRAVSAMKGAFVADAASMGLHWIYDANKIKELTGQHKDAAFFEPPSCPFYSYKSGQFSPYGAECMGVLRGLASLEPFDAQAFSEDYAKFLKSYSGRLNHASKELISNIEQGKKFPACGADDAQANSLVKVPVAVARFLGEDNWPARVEEVIRAHQNNDVAVMYGVASAHILHRILTTGVNPREAIGWAAEDGSPLADEARMKLRDAVKYASSHDATEAASHWGSSCRLPGAFLVSVHVMLNAKTYEDAIRTNIMASGDQCSRGCFIGACMAAANGGESIPPSWVVKVDDFDDVANLTDKLMKCGKK